MFNSVISPWFSSYSEENPKTKAFFLMGFSGLTKMWTKRILITAADIGIYQTEVTPSDLNLENTYS